MFDRIISIDWSGGKSRTEHDHVSLRVALWDSEGFRIQTPPNASHGRRKWSRNECRLWLTQQLRPEKPRTLVAADFAFGLPWGTDKDVFGVKGWSNMVSALNDIYSTRQTADDTAKHINSMVGNSSGPFRMSKEDRTNFEFYINHNVGYFRLTEQIVPQAISVWYLGAGPKVGYHTLTGLPALHWLMEQRRSGDIQFEIWPHECSIPEHHAIVESYPSLTRITVDDWGDSQGGDERDAWKVMKHIESANSADQLPDWFKIPDINFGRVDGISLLKQLQFEGLIFGVKQDGY